MFLDKKKYFIINSNVTKIITKNHNHRSYKFILNH